MTDFNTTGGPAFPTGSGHSTGITKLEFYAAHIAAGIVATEGGVLAPPESVAKRAFAVARAMLAESKRGE